MAQVNEDLEGQFFFQTHAIINKLSLYLLSHDTWLLLFTIFHVCYDIFCSHRFGDYFADKENYQWHFELYSLKYLGLYLFVFVQYCSAICPLVFLFVFRNCLSLLNNRDCEPL